MENEYRMSRLEQRIEDHYQTLRRRVACHKSSPDALAWLFHPSNRLQFIPDYLQLSEWGRNCIQRTLNRLVRDHALFLWYRIFWPKIHRGIVDYADSRYVPGFFHQRTGDPHHKVSAASRYITDRVNSMLSRPWNAAHECAGYEMSNFVADVTLEVLREYGFPDDMFAARKQRQNARCLELLRDIRETVTHHPRCLEILLYCCCRTNEIDSLDNDFSTFFHDFKTELSDMLTQGRLLDRQHNRHDFYHIRHVEDVVNNTPKRILYEGDNCGEVVFDLLLIEYLLKKGHQVDLCAKSGPVVNDATVENVESLLAEELFDSLHKARQQGQLRLLSGGVFPGGGKLLYDASEEYKQAYQQTDLVILKGQGNFQTMPMGRRHRGKAIPYYYDKPLLFIMEPKADMVIAALECIFSARRCPEKHSLFVYYYDPLNVQRP